MERSKDGKSKDGKNKDGKEKAKVKDDKKKTDSKSKDHRDKKCFYCDKIGHVKPDCRKMKRDDEERKTTLAQNSLTSSPAATSPSSLRQLTVSSHVSDDEFQSNEDLCSESWFAH